MSVSIGKARDAGVSLRGVGARFVAGLALLLRPPRFKASRLLFQPRHVALGALAVILVLAAMVFVDARAAAFAHTLPFALVEAFNEITDFGQSGWFLVPLAVLIALTLLANVAAGHLGGLVMTSLGVRFSYLFLAIALPGLFTTIVKRLIGRVRPSDAGPFAYVPWSWRPEYASLPSGHATTAVAAAVAIGAVWPRARLPMWIFAVVIALSRVVITAHFVSDVIAAGFVGAAGALLVRNWYAARGLAFVPGIDGAVHPKPGPSWRRLKAVAARLAGR